MTDEPTRGRLFVVTGGGGEEAATRGEVAHAVAARLDRCLVVEAGAFDAMIVSGREPEPADSEEIDLPWVQQLLLRWSAALATVETYLLEGFDAVVVDDLRGDRLEDFLDLAAPETVLLLVLDPSAGSTGSMAGSGLRIPRWGLWVDASRAPSDIAVDALARLDEARVETAPA